MSAAIGVGGLGMGLLGPTWAAPERQNGPGQSGSHPICPSPDEGQTVRRTSGGWQSLAQPPGRCGSLLTTLSNWRWKIQDWLYPEAGSGGPLTWQEIHAGRQALCSPPVPPQAGRAGTFPEPTPRPHPMLPAPGTSQRQVPAPLLQLWGAAQGPSQAEASSCRCRPNSPACCVPDPGVNRGIWQHLKNNIFLIASAWLHVFP